MDNAQVKIGGVFPLRSSMESNSRVAPEVFTQEAMEEKNLLSDLVPDDIYYTLQEYGLFDEKALRDYHIRKTFKEFRKQMGTTQSIEKLQNLYPYLQFDTLRKIVYKVTAKKGKKQF